MTAPRGDGRPPRSAVRRAGPRGAAAGDLGTLGLGLFLASLGVFFATSFVGYLWVRLGAEAWPPPGAPGLPGGMWASTAVILAGSVTVQLALRAIRRGHAAALRRGLLATTLLATAFLGTQAWNWWRLLAAETTIRSDLFGFTFYVLTGLHAVHIVGGLIPLGVVTARAFRGAYSWAHHAGVRYCATYWHFLGGVWLAMFAMMVLAT